MPFTVSHAAAVLPLRRTRLVWSALVIGSFGPDFEYFVKISSYGRAWHYYPDVLLYCLPFTTLVFALFQILLKRPLTGLLPDAIQRRVDSTPVLPQTVSETLNVLLALVTGIATHIVWDAFTHPHTWPTNHIHTMWKPIAIHGHHMYVYQFLQTLSTAVGLFILAVAFLLWFRRTPSSGHVVMRHSPFYKVVIGGGIVLIALLAGTWYSLQEAGAPQSLIHTSSFDVTFVISVISFFLWELVGYSLFVTLFSKTKGTR